MEYIRRQMARYPSDESRVFESCRGECSARSVNAWRPDSIVVNHLRSLVQLMRPFSSRPCAPVTFVLHGIHVRRYDWLPPTYRNRFMRFLRIRLERHLYRRCARLVVLTAEDGAYARKIYGEELPFELEPNTVEESDFSSEVILPEPWARDQFAFVAIGRMSFPKGFDLLIAAIIESQKILRARAQRLLIVGGGAELKICQEQARKGGVDDLIVFAGEIAGAGACMLAGSVLIAPSRWEGLPYLLLEARSRQRRVWASDCAGNRAALANYDRVTYFPAGDVASLARLICEEGLK